MKNWIQEFKDFVNRGNLVELVIAFVLAAALRPGRRVDRQRRRLMPIIAAIFGEPNFDSITIDIGDGVMLIGT